MVAALFLLLLLIDYLFLYCLISREKRKCLQPLSLCCSYFWLYIVEWNMCSAYIDFFVGWWMVFHFRRNKPCWCVSWKRSCVSGACRIIIRATRFDSKWKRCTPRTITCPGKWPFFAKRSKYVMFSYTTQRSIDVNRQFIGLSLLYTIYPFIHFFFLWYSFHVPN